MGTNKPLTGDFAARFQRIERCHRAFYLEGEKSLGLVKEIEKLCPRCGETKLSHKFYIDSSRKDGLRSQCKLCDAAHRGSPKSNASSTNIKDETGNRYGKLVVIERNGSGGDRLHINWRCKCDCGNEAVIRGSNLRAGVSQTCGCGKKGGGKLPRGVASFNSLVDGMKRHASSRGYEWQLTEAQTGKLTKQNCHYCGIEPSQQHKRFKGNGIYTYNGIDRVDNDKGYFLENVVPCCGRCNRAKSDNTFEDFRGWIKRVHEHLNLGD
jgi:hypothetical protein